VEYLPVTRDDPSDGAADAPADEDDVANSEEPVGVFGNLPRTRPGARSPMRDTGSARARRAPEGKASAPTGAPPASVPPPEPQEPEPADAAQQPAPGGGVEDVAWAGVAAAAEAATIGVRLATRALEAMRDAVERR
jgi:hypothetical protein